MNNKEFVAELAARMNITQKETAQIASQLIAEMSEQLENENVIVVQGLGTFETKKRLERVLINPSTKQRMLVPPKMTVSFKASTVLKEKVNSQNPKQ